MKWWKSDIEMITVGLGNESVWANKINYKYTKNRRIRLKKKQILFLRHSGPLVGHLFYCSLIWTIYWFCFICNRVHISLWPQKMAFMVLTSPGNLSTHTWRISQTLRWTGSLVIILTGKEMYYGEFNHEHELNLRKLCRSLYKLHYQL